jgi:hypothetical protein
MKPRRLGCLTGAGLLAALITLLLVLGLFLLRGGRMFSPGPLHAQGSGLALGNVMSHARNRRRLRSLPHRAVEPHAHGRALPGLPHRHRRRPDRLCVAARRTAEPGRRHGVPSVPHGAPRPGRQSDPRGDSRLSTRSGRVFAGRASVADGRQPPSPVGIATGKAWFASRSWRAATAMVRTIRSTCRCTSPTLEPACLDCHDGIDSFSRANFDHSLVFALTGKHMEAACSGCHAGARTATDLQATPTTCVACHAADDAHDGALGPGMRRLPRHQRLAGGFLRPQPDRVPADRPACGRRMRRLPRRPGLSRHTHHLRRLPRRRRRARRRAGPGMRRLPRHQRLAGTFPSTTA